MWSISEIVDALKGLGPSLAAYGEFELKLWNSTSRAGVGRSAAGNQVLVLPAQNDVAEFAKRYGKYFPVIDARVVDEVIVDDEFSILECYFNMDDQTELRTLAGIFSGLIDVQFTFGNVGLSVWSMKRIFEEGLLAPEADNVTGLIGELLTIRSQTTNKSQMVKAWHSNAGDRYDFSVEELRVEVKASKTGLRHHHFSSSQLPGPPGTRVFIASVLISEVEIGHTLQDLYLDVISGLNPSLARKVSDIVIQTLGVPAIAVPKPVFDLAGATQSVCFVPGPVIPQPIKPNGVISMKWESDLSACQTTELSLPRDAKI